MSEISTKIAQLRTLMIQEGLVALRFKGVDWFAWATGGGSNVVLQTAETGVAEILLTEKNAFVLHNRIEEPRLREEEVPAEFEILVFPWQQNLESEILSFLPKGKVASDLPKPGEVALPASVLRAKLVLSEVEILRYRKIASLSATAMQAALARATPETTELQLASFGAQELISRGIDAALVLAGGEWRVKKHRHPIPKNVPIGKSAMLVFCARGMGLFSNLTRFVYFRDLTSQEKDGWSKLNSIESAAFAATKSGHSLQQVYAAMQEQYAKLGCAEEIDRHHQGGPTGYLSREEIAGPFAAQKMLNIEANTAFAWNPSLPGQKIEDTILLGATGIEVLTSLKPGMRDNAWTQR